MRKLSTYLIGSIQAVSDGGVGWRDKISPDLSEMGFEILDPCKAECNATLSDNISGQKKKLENLKRGGAWDSYDKVMGAIRKNDLVCVNQSEFVIFHYDPTIVIGGSVHELVEAWQKGISVYVVSTYPIMQFNDWLLGLMRDNFKVGGKIFPNFHQMLDYVSAYYKEYINEFKDQIKR